MRIGLFFGSFNPLHIGHLIIGNTILNSGAVDQVWFVLSPQNPFKNKAGLLHEQDRYDLAMTAIYGNSNFRVSDIEFRLSKPSYTVHTLTHISEKYPQHTFSIIMGEDNLSHFHKWKNYEAILNYYSILVFPRPNALPNPLLEGHPNIRKIEDVPLMEISATLIRTLLKENKSIRYLVSEDVEKMIQLRGYYKDL